MMAEMLGCPLEADAESPLCALLSQKPTVGFRPRSSRCWKKSTTSYLKRNIARR